MMEAATEVTGIQAKKQYNSWFDGDCRKVILEKYGARLKCLQRWTRVNQENYNQKRKIANIICKNEEKECLDHKTKEIEDANKHQNVKKFNRDLKEFSKEPIINIPLCKDKNGNVLT